MGKIKAQLKKAHMKVRVLVHKAWLVFKKGGKAIKKAAKKHMKIKVHIRPKDCKCVPHKKGKKVVKKAVKKAVKKGKKVAKKAAKKGKKVAKKAAKKVAPKKVIKKAAPKKVVKKAAPKKVVKKVVKRAPAAKKAAGEGFFLTKFLVSGRDEGEFLSGAGRKLDDSRVGMLGFKDDKRPTKPVKVTSKSGSINPRDASTW